MTKSIALMTVAIATLLFMGVAFAEEAEKKDVEVDEDAPYIQLSGVRNLTRSTLDDVRQGDWLLVIVAPWCGFSRNIVSKLSVIAYNLKQAQVAVIDGEADPSIYIQFSIDSYPYICFVHDGAIHVFNGIPEWDPVLKWASGEWRQVKPLDGPRNPFGWQMTVIGATTHFFFSIYDFVVRNAALISIPPLVAFSVIFGVVTITTLIIVACCVARYDDEIVLPVPQRKTKSAKTEKKPKESKPEEKHEDKPQEEQEKPKDKENEKQQLRQRKSKGPKRLD